MPRVGGWGGQLDAKFQALQEGGALLASLHNARDAAVSGVLRYQHLEVMRTHGSLAPGALRLASGREAEVVWIAPDRVIYRAQQELVLCCRERCFA